MDAFLECSQAKRPDNTLFPDINSYAVGYTDMVNYLGLMLGLYTFSPEGNLAVHDNNGMYICMYSVHEG